MGAEFYLKLLREKHWAKFIPSSSSILNNFTADLEKVYSKTLSGETENEPTVSNSVSDFETYLTYCHAMPTIMKKS